MESRQIMRRKILDAGKQPAPYKEIYVEQLRASKNGVEYTFYKKRIIKK